MFSSAVNNVNASNPTGKVSSAYLSSVNKVNNVNSREYYAPEVPIGLTSNAAGGAVKVPTATSKKNKFP
jgi:hypothetical protein